MLGETKEQFSLARKGLSTGGRAKNPIPISQFLRTLRPLVRVLAVGIILPLFSVILATPLRAQSPVVGPITNSGNGHLYYIVASATWSNAQAEAHALGGNLATIRGPDENAWIVTNLLINFSSSGGPNLSSTPLWIGLYDPTPNDSQPHHAADFVWVSGETNQYRHWNTRTAEPNNTGEFEYYTAINWQHAAGTDPAGTWNDTGLNGTSFAGTRSGTGMGPYRGIAEVNLAAVEIGISRNGGNVIIAVPVPNRTVILEATTNLAPTPQWTPTLTNSSRTNFTIPVSTTVMQMFYRVHIQ